MQSLMGLAMKVVKVLPNISNYEVQDVADVVLGRDNSREKVHFM